MTTGRTLGLRAATVPSSALALALAPALALALAAYPSGATAQVAPAPGVAPGLPSRSQVEQPQPPVQAPGSRVRVDGRSALAAAPCPLATSTVRVTLRAVRFTAAGRDALPPAIAEALADVAPPGTGAQPIAVVCAIRDAANAALARAGYVASVQVPPQRIADGTLQLSVVLARIVEVRVHGEAARDRTVLARAIERLRALDPLNEHDAERLLLLLGDVPGLDVQLSLRPAGTAPGDVIGDLNIATRRVTAIANLQNYGSRALGRGTGYLRVDINSLLAADDTLYVGGSVTSQVKEQQVLQLGYRVRLNDGGLTFGPRVTVAWSRPDLGGLLDLRSRSIIAGADLTQPLLRSVRRNLSVSLGVEAIEQRTRVYDAVGASPLNLDEIRTAYLRLDGSYSRRGADGPDAVAIGGSLEVRRGLGILGATRRGEITADGYAPSRFEGDPQAWVVRSQVNAVVRPVRVFSLAETVLGQWANHPLLNFDEQALGNLTVGLGYDPGSNSADRFVGSHTEARFDLGTFGGGLLGQVTPQLYAFFDNVWLWNLDSFSTETDRHLRSVGGGVRTRLLGPVLLDVSYARPLDRALSIDAARPPSRVLVSLTAQISPNIR